MGLRSHSNRGDESALDELSTKEWKASHTGVPFC